MEKTRRVSDQDAPRRTVITDAGLIRLRGMTSLSTLNAAVLPPHARPLSHGSPRDPGASILQNPDECAAQVTDESWPGHRSPTLP